MYRGFWAAFLKTPCFGVYFGTFYGLKENMPTVL